MPYAVFVGLFIFMDFYYGAIVYGTVFIYTFHEL